MTLTSLPPRRSARVRPYLLVVERLHAAQAHAFGQLAGLAVLISLGVSR
ncbi:hypothetical protein F4561_005655 [Lipingzhangella halophila]|uniref:Uncharacterized protein n=1 Tax=Lipingzhangella halophila TaxID=1783352 RepID=A0A7W7RMN0_9ACTN|nr:hypothetical protein [Lipingzhangella halophila]MBB4934761.1 hypothetical protein [Lipingzhangella halophila]